LTDANVVSAAARGELPEWAVASPERRAHMGRVAALMGEWAGALGLPEREQTEWIALGHLHDALRDAPEAQLRDEVPEHFRDLPGPLLHGPAAAERLEGVVSPALLAAIRYHTVGHPSLDRAGKALYLADFLEPGRDFELEWRDSLSLRMPRDLDEVLVEVVAQRIRHLLDGRKPIRAETAAFWSSLVRRR
jgi:2-amino-4-hydroxy-6-hydroxymethyldihydropteridine diphosphokinase